MPDVETSPSADRRQLQQIIAGLNDGVILVDPDQAIAWANERALEMHGVADMAELGGTISAYRKRFVLTHRNTHELPAGDDPMEQLLGGEAYSEVVVEVRRRGGDRKWVHRIRTLVLTDERGLPDLLVLVINDETELFNAEERFERAFAANPAPAIIARLADMRFIKVNEGFLELTGYTREDLVGRSMHEVDVLRHAERRELAVKRLHAWQTIPQMEGCLALPDGADRTVLLGGQPIEVGDDRCMLFTFADLHPRQLAQHALRHSEERFAKAFHMAPGPMMILALDGFRVMDVNAAFTAATGWTRDEAVGRREAELDLWSEAGARALIGDSLREAGHLRAADIQMRMKDGALTDVLLSADVVEIADAPCVLCLMLDNAERKQTEGDLLRAVESVMRDTTWLSQRIVERMATLTQPRRSGKVPEISGLPARAQEVLSLMAQGLGDDEIARRLGIARNTVRNHVSAIYAKLGIRRRSAVIVWARERGLGAAAKSRISPGKPAKARRH